MTVIEADGVETQPVPVDQLTIYAGQRYSVVVTANQPIGNYCMLIFRFPPGEAVEITRSRDPS